MKFTIPCGQPLYRPAPQPDEWSETYLFRVARANGTYRPRLCDIERIRPTLAATAATKSTGYPVWGDSALPRWSVVTRANKIRYCPECMLESRYIRSRWRLTRLEMCTIHSVRLKDDLAEPVMTLGYKRSDKYFLTEVTNEQLCEGAVCPMPVERSHYQRLWSGFERLIVDDQVPQAYVQLTCILFLEALFDAVVVAVDKVGYRHIDIPRSTRVAETIERMQLPFEPNFDGIRSFLQEATGAPRLAVLSRLRRMLLEEPHRPTCLSKLPIEELRQRYFMSDWSGGTAAAHQYRPNCHGVPDGYVRLREAASFIGCPYGVLKHLALNRLGSDARIVAYGMTYQTYLPRRTVEACRRWFASLVPLRQVQSRSHIEHRGYAALSSMGLLRPLTVDRHTFVRKSDVTDICRTLDRVSRPFATEGPRLYPLFGNWMSWHQRSMTPSLTLVNEALSGKLPVFKKLDDAGLSAYFVDQYAVELLRKLRRIETARRKYKEHMPGQLSLLPS
ncbi:TniQ family protein [Burkholderia cenocepacia]|nr:TniQ family protein [Burkholderia cenocepacia]